MRRLTTVLAVALLLAGCGRASGGEQVVVFAAASLTEAFEQLAAVHPGPAVRLNLAGSQQLAGQLVAGAPADVFAPADEVQLERVAPLLAGAPVPFATTGLAIAVEAGNPHGIASLTDLTTEGLVVVLAAAEVPAGRYAEQALAAAGVVLQPASREPDVRAALSKVRLGEADAALVYATDVAAADGVDAVALPAAHQVTVTYRAAVLAGAPNPQAAQDFVAFLTTAEAQDLLADLGFGPP